MVLAVSLLSRSLKSGQYVRTFASSAVASSSSGSSSSASSNAPVASFQDIVDILKPKSTPTAAAFTSPIPASTSEVVETIEEVSPQRGYSPSSLPHRVDPTLDLFTNVLMKHGKKAEAQSTVSRILSLLQTTTNSAPLPLLHRAFTLASPSLRIVSRRKSAKVILTPKALTERQRVHQAINWILKTSERGRRGGSPREQRIVKEILAVLDGTSDVLKRMDEVHKSGVANRSNLLTK